MTYFLSIEIRVDFKMRHVAKSVYTDPQNRISCKVKAIFHCDTKLLALGTFASPNAKIPT